MAATPHGAVDHDAGRAPSKEPHDLVDEDRSVGEHLGHPQPPDRRGAVRGRGLGDRRGRGRRRSLPPARSRGCAWSWRAETATSVSRAPLCGSLGPLRGRRRCAGATRTRHSSGFHSSMWSIAPVDEHVALESPANSRRCDGMPIRPCRSISMSTEPDAQILARFLPSGVRLARPRLHLGHLAVELPRRPQRQAALEVRGEIAAALEARTELRREDHSTLCVEAVIEPPDEPRHLASSRLGSRAPPLRTTSRHSTPLSSTCQPLCCTELPRPPPRDACHERGLRTPRRPLEMRAVAPRDAHRVGDGLPRRGARSAPARLLVTMDLLRSSGARAPDRALGPGLRGPPRRRGRRPTRAAPAWGPRTCRAALGVPTCRLRAPAARSAPTSTSCPRCDRAPASSEAVSSGDSARRGHRRRRAPSRPRRSALRRGPQPAQRKGSGSTCSEGSSSCAAARSSSATSLARRPSATSRRQRARRARGPRRCPTTGTARGPPAGAPTPRWTRAPPRASATGRRRRACDRRWSARRVQVQRSRRSPPVLRRARLPRASRRAARGAQTERPPPPHPIGGGSDVLAGHDVGGGKPQLDPAITRSKEDRAAATASSCEGHACYVEATVVEVAERLCAPEDDGGAGGLQQAEDRLRDAPEALDVDQRGERLAHEASGRNGAQSGSGSSMGRQRHQSPWGARGSSVSRHPSSSSSRSPFSTL